MNTQIDDPRLTAYALGELDEAERGEVEALLAASPDARREVEAIRAMGNELSRELGDEAMPAATTDSKQHVEAQFLAFRIRRFGKYAIAASIMLAIVGVSASMLSPALSRARNLSRNPQSVVAPQPIMSSTEEITTDAKSVVSTGNQVLTSPHFEVGGGASKNTSHQVAMTPSAGAGRKRKTGNPVSAGIESEKVYYFDTRPSPPPNTLALGASSLNEQGGFGGGRFVSPRGGGGGGGGGGEPTVSIDSQTGRVIIRAEGGSIDGIDDESDEIVGPWWYQRREGDPYRHQNPGEAYAAIHDNPFLPALQNPLSTFSIDVDTASYANIRRFLTGGQFPPADAVRIEEMVNYFSYDYAPPSGETPDATGGGADAVGHPFAVHLESAGCPWNAEHRLVRVALAGREVQADKRPNCNLVFLIDVSGSMDEPNKLPLVKSALSLLTGQLNAEDRVAMVVYAGASGLALPSVTAADKQRILDAIDNLQAGGSTNGGEGIELAYKIAGEHFDKEGVNRVILATDGDFNVGITDRSKLEKLIIDKAKGGVFLSVLGFGMGNLKDATLEQLADKGNGNYAYIDTFAEAKKVFVDEIGATLVTIAKDVKIQVDFNPAQVTAYRLIGYENRILAAQDFNNDKKDAGEIGAGHTVTALYEIVPATASLTGVEASKYQKVAPDSGARKDSRTSDDATSREMMEIRLRYKRPDGDKSVLMKVPFTDGGGSFEAASADTRFAAAVAGFGMLLRGSPHKGGLTYDAVINMAVAAMSKDPSGQRSEFVDLVRKAKGLSGQ